MIVFGEESSMIDLMISLSVVQMMDLLNFLEEKTANYQSHTKPMD